MRETREFSAAWWRRRASTALIVAVLLALVGGVAPAVAAPVPALALTARSEDPPPSDPVDEEHAFYRMLVQDIAEHAEDVEVRDAATAALAVGTKEKLISPGFLRIPDFETAGDPPVNRVGLSARPGSVIS